MSIPKVYTAIATITADLARRGIAKTKVNQAGQYTYRGIDEVCSRLAPLLAQHRLCILPRVMSRQCEEQTAPDGSVVIRVVLHAAFDLTSARDGSVHTIETCGEALDGADKATAKAMSSAYKQAVLLAFCIPVEGSEDPDTQTPLIAKSTDLVADPIQGWEQWGRDISDLVEGCETTEALERVQATYRGLLRAASKREPEIYARIGVSMRASRQRLTACAEVPLKHEKPSLSTTRRKEAENA